MANYFDESYYLAAKLKQLNGTTDPNGQAWTLDSLQQAISDASMTPETHYNAFGRNEKLNPNAYFNESEYLQAKLKQVLDKGENDSNGQPYTLDTLAKAIEAAGMTPAEHYALYGAFESNSKGDLINPSNAFDANAYVQAKLQEMRVAGEALNDRPATLLKPADVLEAIQAAGMTPVTHYMAVGAAEAAATKVALVQTVPVSQRVPNDPVRALLHELVPGNYNQPTVGAYSPDAKAEAVNKPADIGNKCLDTLVSPPIVPPTRPLSTPDSPDYIAPPANLVDTNVSPVIPPTTTMGTGPNAHFVIVDSTTGIGTVIDITTGDAKGEVDVDVKLDGTITPPKANAPILDGSGTNINDSPVDDSDTEDGDADSGSSLLNTDVTTEGTHTFNVSGEAKGTLDITLDAIGNAVLEESGTDAEITAPPLTNVTKIDLSGITNTTGTVTLDASLNTVIKEVKGSTLADTIIVSTNVTAIDGGAGTDTLVFSDALTTTWKPTIIRNIEELALSINNTVPTTNIDMSTATADGSTHEDIKSSSLSLTDTTPEPAAGVAATGSVNIKGIHFGTHTPTITATDLDLKSATVEVTGNASLNLNLHDVAIGARSGSIPETNAGLKFHSATPNAASSRFTANINVSGDNALQLDSDSAPTQFNVHGKGELTFSVMDTTISSVNNPAFAVDKSVDFTMQVTSHADGSGGTIDLAAVTGLDALILLDGRPDTSIDFTVNMAADAVETLALDIELGLGMHSTFNDALILNTRALPAGETDAGTTPAGIFRAVNVEGSTGNDTISGDGAGNNYYTGSALTTAQLNVLAASSFEGGNGADIIRGTIANDSIYGGDDDYKDNGIATGRYLDNAGSSVLVQDDRFQTALTATDNGRGTLHDGTFLNYLNGWLGNDQLYGSDKADAFEYHTDIPHGSAGAINGYSTEKFSALGMDTIYGFELGKDMLFVNMIENATTNNGHGITRPDASTNNGFADILMASDVASITFGKESYGKSVAGKVNVKIETLAADTTKGLDGSDDYQIVFTFGNTPDTLTINLVDATGLQTAGLKPLGVQIVEGLLVGTCDFA